MDLVTISKVPPTVFIDDYPVFWPSMDSILCPDDLAYDYAERWATNMMWLDKASEFDYLVWLPETLLRPVYYAAQELRLLLAS